MTFQTTRWSLILRARQPDAVGREAIEELLAAYWQPVYAFYRRLGADAETAADLTQGLFAHLLTRDDLAAAAPERGRFRAFLATCARHWWMNERARATSAKRGGGVTPLPLDRGETEAWLATEPVHGLDADAVFERRWAQTVIERALWQLEQEELAAGRREQFAVLRAVLDGSPPPEPWAVLATRLDTTEGALKVAAHRLKERFRVRITAEVRQTLADECAPGEELQELLAALQRTAAGFSGDSR